MKIDYRKLDRQTLGVSRWFKGGKVGVFNYFTGVGKTFTAILVILRLFKEDPIHNVVIIVPSDALYKQWDAILNKLLTKGQRLRVSIYTGHWIIANNYLIQTNTLIVDEIHEFLSDELFKVIDGTYIQSDNQLGLTATYEDTKGRHVLLEVIFPVIDRIGEVEAIREGYISPFVEFNLPVSLTLEEARDYDIHSKVISKCLPKFGGDLSLATKCIAGGKHSNGKVYEANHFVHGWAAYKGWRRNLNLNDPRDAEINDMWNPSLIFGYAASLMKAIRLRKDVLYNCEAKFQITIDILQKFSTTKAIVFGQSTAFADKLHVLLARTETKAVVYHSSLQTVMKPSLKTGKMIKFGATRLKNEALAKFASGEAMAMCATAALDRGLDVPDIGLSITASGTSSFTQYKQRGGRAKRKDPKNLEKVAILVNLYVVKSQEKKWLDKRLSTSTHTIYEITSVDQISLSPSNINVIPEDVL